MDLRELMVDSKSVWVDFPGMPGFSVEVANLSKQELNKLRKSCVTQKFDRKTRTVAETLDEERFVERFTEKTVKNWKGLTLDYLQNLLLIDTEGKDMREELEYSQANAVALVTNSVEFDEWLNEVVFDLENFRSGRD